MFFHITFLVRNSRFSNETRENKTKMFVNMKEMQWVHTNSFLFMPTPSQNNIMFENTDFFFIIININLVLRLITEIVFNFVRYELLLK